MGRRRPRWLGELAAVSFDFGNTLVPVDRAGLARVVEATARAAAAIIGTVTPEAFRRVWEEERDRQFRQEVPRFREADLEVRAARVVARLRGAPAPDPDRPWDDRRAFPWSSPEERARLLDAYAEAFVAHLPPAAGAAPLLAALHSRFDLALVSNWPLAAAVDRYLEVLGWRGWFRAVVVSQRVGTIKPRRAIFRAAEEALGLSPEWRPRILHVGDDWLADVVGAHRAGWRAAFLTARPEDSPLPGSSRGPGRPADLEVGSLEELGTALLGDP